MASRLSKSRSASVLARWVLPTPVGPRKRNEPMGLSGSFSPALLRWMALTTSSTAFSWPMTLLSRAGRSPWSLDTPDKDILLIGIPVILETVLRMSDSLTDTGLLE